MGGSCGSYGDRRVASRVLVGRPDGKKPLGRLRFNGSIILKWIFKKVGGEAWSALLWFRRGTGGGHP
jgi:hypothetical protein